jgi:glycosyltransferase involved in cell wall biosynthesis
MKVTFVLNTLNFSGGVKIVVQLANGLQEIGHDVSIWYPLFPKFNGHINTQKLKHIECNVPIHRFLLTREIPKSDLIIATSWESTYFVRKLVPEKGIPVYFIQHIETWDYWNTGRRSWKDEKAIDTYDLPWYKVVTSRWLYDNLRASYTIPLGVEIPEPSRKEYVGNAFGIYRKEYWKGGHVLKSIGGITLLEDVPQEELDHYMRSHDIFISTSKVEGFNLPVLEAMAHGCCVITSMNGAVPEYSQGGTVVFPVWKWDDINMYQSILGILRRDPQFMEIRGNRAREEAKKWTIPKMVERFEWVLKDILSRQ